MSNEVEVIVENGEAVVSSRDVAEKFGKQHKHVLENVDNLAAENPATKNMFFEMYREYRGQSFRYFLMNRDGFTLLAMGFTGKEALKWKMKYINAFNEMEKKLSNQLPDFSNPAIAARAWADQYEARLLAEDKVEVLTPKADFYDAVTKTDKLSSIEECAKVLNFLNVGRNKLYELLRSLHIFQTAGLRWNVPYQKYIDAGYFKLTETFHDNGATMTVKTHTSVTQSGIDFIRKTLLNHGFTVKAKV